MSNAELIGLRFDIENYLKKNKGKIYAPIAHPEFAAIPYAHGPERFDMLMDSLPKKSCKALDIGTHWGYLAHRLEMRGHDVTGVENNKTYLSFLYRLRHLYGDKFSIWSDSIFNIPFIDSYELILALNIFHHFIKDKERYSTFVGLLRSLKCHTLIFQSHNPKEGQMDGAYRNFTPEEFVSFLLENSILRKKKLIGVYNNRPIYKLTTD